jgi:hypothetical protein
MLGFARSRSLRGIGNMLASSQRQDESLPEHESNLTRSLKEADTARPTQPRASAKFTVPTGQNEER